MLKRGALLFLLLLANLSLMAQTNITGVIKDQDGQTMAGVTVLVKGTSVGTLSDSNGKYVLVAPKGSTTMLFSFVGYIAQEVEINGKSVVDVSLESAVTGLDEVVVVGYGTQKRATVTGAISSVTSDKITALPSPGLDQALQGRAAGVTVINNGAPGFELSLIHISEPTRRTPISYAVFCLK